MAFTSTTKTTQTLALMRDATKDRLNTVKTMNKIFQPLQGSGRNMRRLLGFLLAVLIIVVPVNGMAIGAEKSSRNDGDLHCFVDKKYGREFVEEFLSSPYYTEQRAATEGLDRQSIEDIEPLRDPNDSSVCIRFNDIYAHVLASRFIDDSRYAALTDSLDPMAHRWAISYYRVGPFYFVLIGQGQPKATESDSLAFISTGDDLSISVYDSDLKLIATRACPGPTCPPDEFRRLQQRYSH